MKKILYLAKKEAFLLKKSIILIICILTIFLAAFMGVFSVRTNYIDSYFETLDNSTYTFYVEALKMDLQTAEKLCGEQLYVCGYAGITEHADIYNAEGEKINIVYFGENGTLFLHGAFVPLNEKTRAKFATQDDVLISGKWVDDADGICVSNLLAELLSLEIGDTVRISEHEYGVIGIFDESSIDHDYFFNYHFYLLAEEGVKYSSVGVVSDDAASSYSVYKKFAGKGYSPSTGRTTGDYFYTITPLEWSLNCVIILLLCVIIIILYTLMTAFYRQRKRFICQLQLIGADNVTITAVYLVIAVGILLISNILAAALGVLFNNYFMNLCSTIFELAFVSAFNFWVPVASFGISCLIAALLYVLSGRSIKSKIIAQEIRCE